MKKHTLKISPAVFAQIRTGAKTFLLGKYDHPFQPGDDLVLVEYVASENISTGQTMQKKIVSVLQDVPHYGLQPGHCIVSFTDHDTTEFLEECKQTRVEFSNQALANNWWMDLGVDRVAFESVLIMYDQLMERIK